MELQKLEVFRWIALLPVKARCFVSVYSFVIILVLFAQFPLELKADTTESIISTHFQKDPSRVVEMLQKLNTADFHTFSPDMLVKASYAAAITANTQLAIDLTRILEEKADQLRDRGIAGQAFYNRGAAYAYAGNHDLALDAFLLSLYEFESVNSIKDIARIKGALALIYVEIEEYELAVPYFEEALAAHIEQNDRTNMAKVYANRGFLRLQLKQYESARSDLLQAIALAQELNYKSTYPTLYKNLGVLEAAIGDSQIAFDYFEQSLVHAKANNLDHHASEIMRETARLEMKLGDLDSARENLERSIEVGKEYRLLKQLRNSYFLLAELEASLKNYEVAYFAKENALSAAEEMGESKIAYNLSRLERYTTRIEEENKLILLEQQNKIATLAAEREALFKKFFNCDSCACFFLSGLLCSSF